MTDDLIVQMQAAAKAADRPMLTVMCVLPDGRYAGVDVEMCEKDLHAPAADLTKRYGHPAFAQIQSKLIPK